MASAPDQPADCERLTENQADRLFVNLAPLDAVALAVSGGADSLALLYLFNDWRLRTDWSGKALVLTVDHRLRSESAAEAAAVKHHCGQLGLAHETLVWEGEKPTANVQAEARSARYRLMAEKMHEYGIECLLLAHHRDDQVETFLDRLTRGSGVYGLGAMAPGQPNGPHGLRLVRPLLAIPKVRLVAELVARNIPWAEDPSNAKLTYKRARLRSMAAALAEEGLGPGRLVETAKRMRRASAAIDAWVGNAWTESVDEHPAGPLRLPLSALATLPEEVRLRLLAQLILRVSGCETPLRLAKLEALAARLLAQDGQSTLAGTIVLREGPFVYVWKEAGRQLPQSLDLTAGSKGIWDDRYAFAATAEEAGEIGGPIVLGPLAAAPTKAAEITWPQDWPKACFVCAPALWRQDELLAAIGLFSGETEKETTAIEIRRLPRRFGGDELKN